MRGPAMGTRFWVAAGALTVVALMTGPRAPRPRALGHEESLPLVNGTRGTQGITTPPRPPAEIRLVDAVALAKLELRDGSFVLPLRLLVHEEVGVLSVQWRILPTDGFGRKAVREGRFEFPSRETRSEQPFDLSIPVLEKRGRYRVELELTGRVGGKQAVVDRIVLYQLVGDGRPALTLPADLRRRDQAQRLSAFRQQLDRFPDRPDVRLLAPGTAAAPPAALAAIEPIRNRPPLQVRGEGPPALIRRYVNDRVRESWTGNDPITVRGRIVYEDFEGTWRPLINVSVNLYDDDTFGDEHLGTTVTDWNGEWSFTVNNDDGFWQNGRDVYYEFHLANTRWAVRDDDDDDYLWQSAVRDDVSDGTVVDFGGETGSTDPESMHVFAVLNLGWNHITTAGGQDPGMIAARFPTSGSFFSPADEHVHIDAADNDSPDTILHEYGHALMHKAFGGTSISPGGSHSFSDDAQDEGLAYSEGWATGYMLSVCPDSMYNWHEGNAENAGEWPTCMRQDDGGQEIELFGDAGNRIGEKNEGRVAAAVNDFRDRTNDDNGGSLDRGRTGESDANSANTISLATLYRDNMWGVVHDDFLDYWITLAGDLTGTPRTRAGDIMQYNWMSLPIDVSCVASKVAVAERPDAVALLVGLRAFRDKGLKPLQAGRRWIQAYYSHSPEMAMLLLRDREARQAAVEVIVHFAQLGRAFASQKTLEDMFNANAQVLPGEVERAAQRVLQSIEKGGSPELRREVEPVRVAMRSFRGLSLAQALRRTESMTAADKGGAITVVRPRDLAPASRKADWLLIRKNLPPGMGIREGR